MITVNGRFVARAVMVLAGAALAVTGVLAARANRYTPRDLIITAIAVAVGAVAALWLRRDSRQRGGRS